MAINDTGVSSGQLITATHHNNVNDDANNTGDNIHPQYFDSVGSLIDQREYRLQNQRVQSSSTSFIELVSFWPADRMAAESTGSKQYDDSDESIVNLAAISGVSSVERYYVGMISFVKGITDTIQVFADLLQRRLGTTSSDFDGAFSARIFRSNPSNYTEGANDPNGGYLAIGSEGNDLVPAYDDQFKAKQNFLNSSGGTTFDLSSVGDDSMIHVFIGMESIDNNVVIDFDNSELTQRVRNIRVDRFAVNNN